MREVLAELLDHWRADRPVALATVTDTWASAPRPAGATMLLGPDGSVSGSVSGGCVEAAVHLVCEQVLADGRPRTERYGVSDDDALAVGLPCGGTVEVFVERVDRHTFPELDEFAADLAADRPVATALCVRGPVASLGRRLVVRANRRAGTLGDARLDAAVARDALGWSASGGAGLLHYDPPGGRTPGDPVDAGGPLGSGGPVDAGVPVDAGGRQPVDRLGVLVQGYPPPARMLVFGAADFTAALVRIGTFLGYRVTVCDARPVFATARRFPEAAEVVVDWPHRYLAAQVRAGRLDARTVVCVLTHDARFDVPVLRTALELPLAYVGAMGSRRTHADRVARLRAAGVPDAALRRLRSPIGLDLGARTPEETAVSIAAEIVAARRGGGGAPLSGTTGPLHH